MRDLLNNNPLARKAYSQKYANEFDTMSTGMVDIPTELFMDFSKYIQEQNMINLEEFNKFHQYLLLNFTGLPLFPEISFAYLNLQKTKILLEMYTSEILQRDDILGNPQTEIFFDLKKNHFCDFYLYQPTLILIDLKSSYLIRVKELDIFISFFKNEISILDFDLENQKNFKIINKIILKDEISCIKYRVAEHRHYLLVGFVTGVIYLYRINDKNKIPKQLFGEKSKNFELDNTKMQTPNYLWFPLKSAICHKKWLIYGLCEVFPFGPK